MKKYFFAGLTFLICASLCHAQDKGCFKLIHNELELDSTTDLGKNKVFFVGEFHGVYGISEVKLALTKYVNKRYGITDVFMEIGISAAWLYNRYLATGDTTLFTTPLLVYAGKQPNRDFWKQLYRYNKTLEHKITIHGIDFERMEFVKVLKLLMPAGKRKPEEILATLTYLDTLVIANVNNGSLNPVYEKIKKDINGNRAGYMQYYGPDFKIVDDIMFNENTFSRYLERDEAMYKNMVKQTGHSGIKKFITFNGMNHADRADETALCSLLMKNDSFKNKVVNIAMVCKNCYDLQLPQNKQTSFRAPYTYEKDSISLNSIYTDHFNRFCKYTMISTDAVKDDKVRRFSQYLILMTDQPEY